MTVHLQGAHITAFMHKEEPFRPHCILSGPLVLTFVLACDKRTPPNVIYPLNPTKTDANLSKDVY